MRGFLAEQALQRSGAQQAPKPRMGAEEGEEKHSGEQKCQGAGERSNTKIRVLTRRTLGLRTLTGVVGATFNDVSRLVQPPVTQGLCRRGKNDSEKCFD